VSIDSFKYLPGSIANYYRNLPVPREAPVPWTPLKEPLNECRFALVTTAAISVEGLEPPFDAEREKREPMWGDPTFRRIPRGVRQEQVRCSHLHINNRDILSDVNIVLPVQRFLELESEGAIGSLAPTNYSFMGYQMNTGEWQNRYGGGGAAEGRGRRRRAVDPGLTGLLPERARAGTQLRGGGDEHRGGDHDALLVGAHRGAADGRSGVPLRPPSGPARRP